jgi:hypothetical protein
VNKLNKILIGLIVVQFALAVVMLTRDDKVELATMQPVLAGFDSAQVTRIQVFDKNAETAAVDLVKTGEAWTVATAFSHPVDASKVTDLLGKLANMKSRGPMATSAVRGKQLGVDDKAFEKKLVVTTPKGDVAILVGTQTGGRSTPVRVGGSPKVYGVTGITPWAIDADPGKWIATDYVSIAKDDIAKVVIATAAGVTELERTPTSWQLTTAGQPVALAPGEALDPAAVDKILTKVSSIKIFKPGDPARDASAPTATVSVWLVPADPTALGGDTAERLPDHVIDIVEDGENYWVHDRAAATAGMVGKEGLREVVEASRDKLVTKTAEPPKPAAPKPAAPKPAPKSAPKPAPPTP